MGEGGGGGGCQKSAQLNNQNPRPNLHQSSYQTHSQHTPKSQICLEHDENRNFMRIFCNKLEYIWDGLFIICLIDISCFFDLFTMLFLKKNGALEIVQNLVWLKKKKK